MKALDGQWLDGFAADDVVASLGTSSARIWGGASAYELLLRSLVVSGDLKEGEASDQGRFWLEPKGIATLAEYEVEERRHWLIVFLTSLIAIGTVVAAVR